MLFRKSLFESGWSGFFFPNSWLWEIWVSAFPKHCFFYCLHVFCFLDYMSFRKSLFESGLSGLFFPKFLSVRNLISQTLCLFFTLDVFYFLGYMSFVFFLDYMLFRKKFVWIRIKRILFAKFLSVGNLIHRTLCFLVYMSSVF